MTGTERVVADTNILVSRLLMPKSLPAQAVDKMLAEARILASDDTLAELATVLARPKFDRYTSVVDRRSFLRQLHGLAELVPIMHKIVACRDPKDDKFLELAINGSAAAIVTGDADLLTLHPFRGVRIVTPRDYL
jgi:putative PIN family toxin of toxin-antitoxin system